MKSCLRALVRAGSIDSKNYTLRAMVSTKQVDRYRSIILPQAYAKSIETYMSNPVILWMHQLELPPIAKCVGCAITPDGLEKTIQFAVNEDTSGFAKQIWNLYEGGYLNAFSVHGGIQKYVGNWSDREERAALPDYAREALDTYQADYVVTELDLWESSGVTVPGNPGATKLEEAVEKGVIPGDFLAKLHRAQPPVETAADEVAAQMVRSLAARVATLERFVALLADPQMKEALQVAALAARLQMAS